MRYAALRVIIVIREEGDYAERSALLRVYFEA